MRIMLWKMAPELMLSRDPDYLRLPGEGPGLPQEFRFHVTLVSPGDWVLNDTVYWLDPSRPPLEQRTDLRALFPSSHWEGNTFVVPTVLTPAAEPGLREFEVEDNHGNVARAGVTLRPAASASTP